MMPLKKILTVVGVITLIVVGCSVLRKETDQDVQIFLTKFQNTLTATDNEILAVFKTSQSRETIIQALRVLQNKSSEYVQCNAFFSSASITRYKDYIEAIIPVSLSTRNLDKVTIRDATITLNLIVNADSYSITKFSAEDFYQAFTAVKNAGEWALEQQAELDKRKSIYAKAHLLQEQYDTIIWYATYKNKNYYYGADAWWSNYFMEDSEGTVSSRSDAKLGLVDEEGNVIIPFEYNLIGTIGFETENLVEVNKDGHYGYYDIAQAKQVIEPVYDMIIPYQKENVWAIVKNDTTFGWYDNSFQYNDGFPSAEAEEWVRSFKYLSREVVLKDGNQVFCEIPNKDFAGYGIIMPPSYFVKHNLFTEIVGGVNTTQVPMSGWTDYFGIQESMMQTINDKFNAIITVVQERYLGGREEFYGESKVVFMNDHHDLVAITKVPTDQEILITAIDNSLIEIKANSTGAWMNAHGGESNIPEYSYFRINSDYNLKALTTNRRFAFTEFVKMDSTYLTGDFTIYTGYNEETEETFYDHYDFLSKLTIQEIRNEILATYGYDFPDPQIKERFVGYEWYNPRYSSITEFEDKITEIDKYNLDFLARIISYMENKSV